MKPALWKFVAKTGIQQKKLGSWNGYLHILRIQLCTKYLGFGDGETYPFESDHGTQLNGTIVEGNTYLEKPLIDWRYLISVLFYRYQLPMSRRWICLLIHSKRK